MSLVAAAAVSLLDIFAESLLGVLLSRHWDFFASLLLGILLSHFSVLLSHH